MSDSDDSLTEPDWTEPEWAEPDGGRSPGRPRHERRVSREPVPRRTSVIIAVIAVIAGVAGIAAAAGTPAPAAAPSTADGIAVAPATAYSSSAFCSAGTGTAANTTIYLTNSTRSPVSGVMTTVAPAGAAGAVPTVRRSVTVPALGTLTVDPADGLPAGSNASGFSFAGGGVVASQVVSGANGWTTAPCASRIASEWDFAGGSTTTGNTLTLSLYNPAATEAVVNVSFLTGQGLVTPQKYQGLEVPAGQLVEENVGDYVQGSSASTIATMVVAQAGGLVSSEFQQWSSGPTGGMSLRLGSPALSTSWRLAQTTAMPQSTVDLYLAKTGSSPATATITLGLSSGTVVPHRVVVPPVSITAFPASGTPGLPQQTPYAVTVTSTAPIVVGRSVEAPPGSPSPVWGSSAATTTVATHWLVPGPGVPGAPAITNATVSSLAVANSGTTASRVVVARLGGTRTVAMFTVAPGRIVVLGPKQVGGLATLTVSASQPVFVEEDSQPAGTPGIVSSSGFSLGS